MVSLADSTSLLSLLADATRVRLLALLHEEELSVAELTKVTELSQSRVSTHLGKLREAGLVTLADGHGRAEVMLAGAEIAGLELRELETADRTPSPKMAALLERFTNGAGLRGIDGGSPAGGLIVHQIAEIVAAGGEYVHDQGHLLSPSIWNLAAS